LTPSALSRTACTKSSVRVEDGFEAGMTVIVAVSPALLNTADVTVWFRARRIPRRRERPRQVPLGT
jgi:hypothetical protein